MTHSVVLFCMTLHCRLFTFVQSLKHYSVASMLVTITVIVCVWYRVSAVWSRAHHVRSRLRRVRRLTQLLSHSSFKALVPGNSRRHSVEYFPRSCHSTSYLLAILRVVTASCVETTCNRAAPTKSHLTASQTSTSTYTAASTPHCTSTVLYIVLESPLKQRQVLHVTIPRSSSSLFKTQHSRNCYTV